MAGYLTVNRRKSVPDLTAINIGSKLSEFSGIN